MISPDPRRRRGVPRPLGILLVASLFFALLYFLSGPLSRLLHGSLFPLYGAQASSASFVGDLFAHWRTESELIAENAALQEEVATSRLLLLDRNRLYEENISLKERMGRLADPDAVLATIILRPPQTPYDTLLLDVGTAEGVARGDLVSAGGSLLIGEVREAYAHSSRVVLFSSPGEIHDGFLDVGEGERREPLILEGQGGGSLVARIPRGVLVLAGSVVSVPSISANMAAVVEHVESSVMDSLQTLHLRLPTNFFELERVEVWRNSPPTP